MVQKKKKIQNQNVSISSNHHGTQTTTQKTQKKKKQSKIFEEQTNIVIPGNFQITSHGLVTYKTALKTLLVIRT